MVHNITVERDGQNIVAECSCGATKSNTDPKSVSDWATKHQAENK